MRTNLIAVGAMLILSVAALAESPLAGTWKMQPDPHRTLKIGSDGHDGIVVSTDKQGPVFGGPLDGSKRPGLGDMKDLTVVLNQSGDRGLSVAVFLSGREVWREDMVVSADGTTLMESETELGSDQGPEVIVSDRVAGDGNPYPFIGEWRMDPARSKRNDYVVSVSDLDGVVTFKLPLRRTLIVDANKSKVRMLSADGSPEKGSGVRSAGDVRRIGERAIEYVLNRQDGTKVRIVWDAGEDGKTLTEHITETAEGKQPRVRTMVYERQ